MTKRRVINLGLPKSGTTTLETALRQAGFRIADWKIREADCDDKTLVGRSVAKLFYDNFYGSGDPLAGLDAFDAFTEISIINLKRGMCIWPQTDFALIRAIYDAHPEVVFVATTRAADKIADSMMRWNNLGSTRLPNGPVPGMPSGYGTDAGQIARWIAGHYAHLDAIFAGDPRYLALDVTAEDARDRLSSHVGADIDWWGRANENLNRPATEAAQ